MFNKRSRLYVLWINAQNCASACPPGSVACYLTWTSSSPTGPFEAQGPVHTRFTAEGGVGDFSLFLDDDEHQTGWVIHKRTGRAPPPNGHRMLIEKLSPDYLRSTNETLGVFGDPFVEAPVLFKRKGVYYALFGKCCCFCAGGSGVGVYTAATAAGPYTKHQNIGCPTEPQGTCGCSSTPDPDRSCAAMKSVTMAQQNFVIQIPPTHPGEETQFLWTGDMWQSACRIHGLNCVKGWDLQYWSPLSWNDTTHPPLPVRMHWVDNVTIPPQVPQLAP